MFVIFASMYDERNIVMKINYIIMAMMLIVLLTLPGLAHNDLNIISVPYQEKNKTVEIDVNIPVIIGMDDNNIQSKYNKILREDFINFSKEIKRMAEEFYKDAKDKSWPFHRYIAMADYEVCNKDKIFSIVVDYYQYTGGAHGITTRESYNIDLETGKNLSLAEFISLASINMEKINNKIAEKIRQEPGNYFTDNLGFQYISNTDDYFVMGNNLFVFFQFYEIAPYVAGIPEFRIPFSYK